MKNRGLRFEFIVTVVLLVASAAGLMGLLVYKTSQREMLSLKVESGLILVRTLASDLSTGGLQGDYQEFIRIAADSEFEELVVLKSDGTPVIETPSWKANQQPSPDFLREVMKTRQISTRLGEFGWLPFGRTPELSISAPVIRGYEVIGAVGIHSSLDEISKGWVQVKWIILVYIFLDTIVIGLCGAYLLSFRLVQPLRRMVDRVEDLAAGKFEPQSRNGEGVREIVRLEEAFESMAGKLLDSRERLEKNIMTLEEAQESLVRSEKMASVGRLAAGLAHELGNPLGALLGFVHLLKRPGLKEEKRKDFLVRMESELTRMDGIIRSLLDFARQKPVEPGPVDLNEIARHALSLAGVQKWFSGLETSISLEDNLPQALGEKNRLTQVLINLLANAGQAMNGSGRLSLTTGQSSGKVFIAVTDSGPGISPEDLPQIFDPFFTLKEPGQGTGLGLTVSQSIVESFGGGIEVWSRPGEGSTFRVLLLKADSEAS